MIRPRLFKGPQWEVIRFIYGPTPNQRLERRLVQGAVCLRCGKRKAYQYRLAADGLEVWLAGTWCCEGHAIDGNRINRLELGPDHKVTRSY